MIYLKRKALIIVMVVCLIQPIYASDMAASAVRNLASNFAIPQKCIGGDRSVFYIRILNEESLRNRLEYACMVIVDEAVNKKDLIITYWPILEEKNWIDAENSFLNQFVKKRALPIGHEILLLISDMPLISDVKSKFHEFNVTINRSMVNKITPHLYWNCVLIWGNNYTQIGSNVVKTAFNSSNEAQNGLNGLIMSIINRVIDDGITNGVWANKKSVYNRR